MTKDLTFIANGTGVATATTEENGRTVVYVRLEPAKDAQPSASGKTLVQASTHGAVPVVVDGAASSLSLNLYTKNPNHRS